MVDSSISRVCQGDHLPEVTHLHRIRDDGVLELVPTPQGVVVLTQDCDLAQEGHGDVHLSPLVKLADSEARDAKAGRTSRYIEATALDGDNFVDLGLIGCASQDFVRRSKRTQSMLLASDPQALGRRVARRFSRFACPDALYPVINPLRSRVRDKAGRGGSALGRVLSQVETLRLESGTGWETQSSWNLLLLIVLKDGNLSTNYSTAGDVPNPTSTADAGASISSLAEQLDHSTIGSPEHGALWDALGKALVAEMTSKGAAAVGSITFSVESEVMDTTDFSFARYLRSVDLDLDNLSPAYEGGR